jgi:hypothetical protein
MGKGWTMKVLVWSALAIVAAGAMAQQPVMRRVTAPSTAPATPVDSKAVVAELRRLIAANYVLPEMRPKLDAALAAGLANGRYDVADPSLLADRINEDLAATGHDKHLNFHYAPDQAAQAASRRGEADDDGPTQARQAQLRNYGISEMKVLPGNLRYVAIDGFVWAGPNSAEAYDVAMRFLKGGDAAIIDLRKNGGGSPAAVQYVISHFLPANKPIVTFYMGSSPAEPHSTLPSVPAGSLAGKPLYVLISGRTASAAEEFTGHVYGYKLGELIGANTAGAGFRNTIFPVPGGFLLSVSVGRAVLASTGKDWEGKGFAPATAVDPDKALDVAQLHAMRKLAETATPREKKFYEAQASLLAAKVEPVPTALPAAAYAGKFGDRSVTVEGGKLLYRRGDGPQLELIAIGPNIFTFGEDPSIRVTFAVAGTSATGFEMVRGDGSKVEAMRTQ